MATIVYTTMQPAAQDDIQVLLCKAAYYLQAAAESASVTAATAMYPSMTPYAQDSLQVLAAKLAYWASQVTGGGGGGGGAFTVGTGNPEGVVTGSPGDRFWDSVNDFQYTKVTGTSTNTGWKNS